ncbi:MAG: peptidoglycan-binding domain-containing protein [Actinomycetota bacterium]
MTEQALPITAGDRGDSVRALHERLAAAGVPPGGDPHVIDAHTRLAVRGFLAWRRLRVDGVVARQTWGALVESDYRLGDRMLYRRAPMTRGDDVTELQWRLGSLGFDAGYVDGIFGPDTERAVRAFQANQAVTPDGVVGPDTVAALGRLAGRRSGEKTIAEVREAELLRAQSGLRSRRLVVGQAGGVSDLVEALADRLRAAGAEVLALHHRDLSTQARTANEWDGAIYLGIAVADDEPSIAYFQTEGFVSYGGRGLAAHTSEAITTVMGRSHPAVGMRIPILRETRMPAVWCRVALGDQVDGQAASLAVALEAALTTWCDAPEHTFGSA